MFPALSKGAQARMPVLLRLEENMRHAILGAGRRRRAHRCGAGEVGRIRHARASARGVEGLSGGAIARESPWLIQRAGGSCCERRGAVRCVVGHGEGHAARSGAAQRHCGSRATWRGRSAAEWDGPCGACSGRALDMTESSRQALAWRRNGPRRGKSFIGGWLCALRSLRSARAGWRARSRNSGNLASPANSSRMR